MGFYLNAGTCVVHKKEMGGVLNIRYRIMRQFELNTKMHYCLFEVRIAGQNSAEMEKQNEISLTKRH